MAIANSYAQFPIVKVIPVAVLDMDKERIGGSAIGAMVVNALVSLQDMRSLWTTDHDSTDLKEKFDKLYYQLNSLQKYCEDDK